MERKKPARKNSFRREARQKRERWYGRLTLCMRLLVWGIALCGTSLFFIFGYDFFTQWDYFQARKVVIQGNFRTAPEEIMAQAGVRPGVNILGVNLAAVRKRLAAHPWIADAEIRRRLPDRFEIRITEHEPLAVIDLGRQFLMNRRGEIFKAREASERFDVPLVKGLSASDVETRAEVRTPPVEALLEVLTPGVENDGCLPVEQIREIHVDPELGLTLYAFENHVRITLGYSDYQNKYHCLERLMDYVAKRGKSFADIEAVNLINTDRIILRSANIDLHGNQQEKEV